MTALYYHFLAEVNGAAVDTEETAVDGYRHSLSGNIR